MRLPSLDPRRARDLVGRFRGVSVLIVGDVMVDRFIVGRVTRISPEAPVPVVQFQTEQLRLGGAGNVAHNIVALGGQPSLVGVVGADAAAARLRELLAATGLDADGLIEDPARPTTEKVRVVTERNQQVARVDYESDRDVTGEAEQAILARIHRHGAGARALLVSDYLKGTVTRSVMDALPMLGDGGRRRPLIIDPKIPHLTLYAGSALVTPNHHEAETATHRLVRTDEEARDAGRDFRSRVGCEAVLITRGEHGMWLSSDNAEGSIPSDAREVSDVTGAGDTVAATLALAIAVGATLTEAAALANLAAGIVVGKFGPATVTAQELIERF